MDSSLGVDQAWFVLSNAEKDGLRGSSASARAPSYPIRQTRAMLSLDTVGEPPGLAGDSELLTLGTTWTPREPCDPMEHDCRN